MSKKQGLLAEVLVEPPALPAGEGAVEVSGVAVVEVRQRLGDERLDPVGSGRADARDVDGGVERLPRGDALAPDPTLRRLADPFDRDEAVLDAHT